MTSILLIGASPSAPSRSARLLEFLQARIASAQIPNTTLYLRDLPAQALLQANTSDPAIQQSITALENASAVVLVTPIYKAAYAGLLKVWLDLLPQYALREKSILPFATAGSLAHALALDYALRPVLNSMGPRHIGSGWVVIESQMPRDEHGQYILQPDIGQRITDVVDAFLQEL